MYPEPLNRGAALEGMTRPEVWPRKNPRSPAESPGVLIDFDCPRALIVLVYPDIALSKTLLLCWFVVTKLAPSALLSQGHMDR